MRTIILFICLFEMLFFCGYSQQQLVDISENTALQSKSFTYIYPNEDRSNLDIHKSNFIENIKQIPSYGLYNRQWDTSSIYSSSLPVPFYNDMIKIIPVEKNNTAFVFPCRGFVALKYGQQKKFFHVGIDFSMPEDEPVYSCFDGVVRVAKIVENYGKIVIIRHFNGMETVYSNLNKIRVFTGQKVKSGDIVGTVGSSTASKDGTLHFETRFLNYNFDPMLILNIENRVLQNDTVIIKRENLSVFFQ